MPQSFALIMAEWDLQLPAPLTSDLFPRPKGSCINVRLVPNSGLEVSATIPGQQMHLELQDRQGTKLIAVTKQMSQEAAHLQYTCVAKSPLAPVAWAKILDNVKAEYVTHCAVIQFVTLTPYESCVTARTTRTLRSRHSSTGAGLHSSSYCGRSFSLPPQKSPS